MTSQVHERGAEVVQVAPCVRRTLTVEEAARILGISRSSAYAAANAGDLRVVRVGRRLLVPTQEIDRLLGTDQSMD